MKQRFGTNVTSDLKGDNFLNACPDGIELNRTESLFYLRASFIKKYKSKLS